MKTILTWPLLFVYRPVGGRNTLPMRMSRVVFSSDHNTYQSWLNIAAEARLVGWW